MKIEKDSGKYLLEIENGLTVEYKTSKVKLDGVFIVYIEKNIH
jgi:hypothetical protein